MFEALCELSPDNAPAESDDWLERCIDFLPKRGARQKFYDIRKQLVDKGYLLCDTAGVVTRRLE